MSIWIWILILRIRILVYDIFHRDIEALRSVGQSENIGIVYTTTGERTNVELHIPSSHAACHSWLDAPRREEWWSLGGTGRTCLYNYYYDHN